METVNSRPAKPKRTTNAPRGGRDRTSQPSKSRPSASTKRTGKSTGPATRRSGKAATSRRTASSSDTSGSWQGRTGRQIVLGQGDSRRPIMSLRALALIVVCLMAVVIVTPTAYRALSQDEQMRSIEGERLQLEQRLDGLNDEIARWDDDTYVQAQARARLGYIMPGQTPYVVVDPEHVTGGASADEAATAQRDEAVSSLRPWYGNMWESVREAGEDESLDSDDGDNNGVGDDPSGTAHLKFVGHL